MRKNPVVNLGLAMIFALGCPLTLSGCSKKGDEEDNVYMAIGDEGDSKARHEKSFEYHGKGEKTESFELNGTRYTITFAPLDGDPRSWDVRWYRGDASGEQIGRTIVDDNPDSFGACASHTDFARTDGLWLRVGVQGKQMSGREACAQLNR